MRRRSFLASSVPALAGLAGCVGGAGSPGTPGQSATRATTPEATSRATTDSPGPVEDAPAPPPASDVFDHLGCPSFDDSADRTVCYHAVDPSSTDVVLGVDPEVFDPYLRDGDVETLTFRLYNRSAWHFHVNPDGWGIERFDDGEWDHVAPAGHDASVVALPPGATYTWELPSEPHPTPFDERYSVLDLALSAGVYAFHVAGSFDAGFSTTETATDTPTAEPPDEHVECVGLFRLDDDVDPSAGGGTPRRTETGTRHGG